MPIKQVVCSICKEMVNKAITYHVGGTDRACKKHEGVTQKKDELEVKKQVAHDKSVRKLERRREPVWSEPSNLEEAMKPKCWVCMNTGMRAQEFFMQTLVNMAKDEKVHGRPMNPFDPAHRPQPKERCIFVLPKEKCEVALPYIREEFRMLIDMTGGALAICGDCCHVMKIEALPPVKAESLSSMMVIGQIMKPAFQEIAAKELARDN